MSSIPWFENHKTDVKDVSKTVERLTISITFSQQRERRFATDIVERLLVVSMPRKFIFSGHQPQIVSVSFAALSSMGLID